MTLRCKAEMDFSLHVRSHRDRKTSRKILVISRAFSFMFFAQLFWSFSNFFLYLVRVIGGR